MKYKNLTFFDKYNIETTTPSQKIMVLFQTNPQKRKDLPIVISILKSEEALFEEELFTCNENPTNRNKLLNLLKNRNANEFWFPSFIETFDNFYEEDLKSENFTHSKNLDDKKVIGLIKEFKAAIFDEYINIVFDDLTSLSPAIIDLILKNSSKINPEYELKIINLISDKIEFYFSKSEDQMVIRDAVDFIAQLSPSVTKNLEIYKSILYFLNGSLLNKSNSSLMNEYFIKIFKILNKQDQQKYASCILTYAHELIDLQNNKKYDFEYLKKQTIILAKNYIYYYQNIKTEEFSLDENECELCINYLGYLVSSTRSWYKEYLSYVDRLQQSNDLNLIYNFISHMLLLRWNSKFYKGFAVFLTKITRLEPSLLEWANKKDVLKTVKERVSKLSFFEKTNVPYILMSDEIKEKIITTEYVDTLLCKYYWVYLFNDALLNDIAISNLKNSVFDRLMFFDEDIFSPYAPAKDGLNIKGQFLVKVVSEAPSDWELEGMSVNEYLGKIKFSLESTYGVSNLQKYARAYKEKIVNAKNQSRNSDTYQIILDGKNAIENYRKAKEFYINRKYEPALNLFTKIKDYKDSENWILKCEEKIKEMKYFSALADEERCLYQSAYKKFEALGNYNDSIKRACENKIRYHVKNVNEAKKFFENENYEKALELLEDIRKDYSEAEILFVKYSERYNSIRYEQAVSLFQAKKYYDARKLFIKIENYLDSKKYIIECNDQIKEIENQKCYESGLNYYENFCKNSDEEDIKKAISIFETLALQKYKDSEEKLTLCKKTYENYKHKVKVRLRIVFCAILAILITIAIAVPVGIHSG